MDLATGNVRTPPTVGTIGTYGGVMLFIINAADVQFRHESAFRSRDDALLASIRERRAGETAVAAAGPAGARQHERRPAGSIAAPRRSTRVTWARTRVIENCPTALCAG
jgi:hypothetical protein